MKVHVRRDRRFRIALAGMAAALFPDEAAHVDECIRCARQPSTLYGSPETIVDKGIDLGIKETAKWADRIVASIGDADTASEIRARTRAAAKRNDLKPFARNARERMLHGACLAALDSNWEGEHGGVVEPPRFVDVPPRPGFASMPFEQAISFFRSKKVVTPDVFKKLDAGSKRRAFTVARLANEELLGAVHSELARIMKEGGDLSDFKRFAKDRLESAGWVPANKSHVELIYRNNVIGAYGAGRRAEMTQPAVLKARPIFQCRGVKDDRQRKHHRAVDGKAARADDPVFKHLWTPFGHNCRCRFISRSEAEAKRLGIEIVDGSVFESAVDVGWETRASTL